MIIRYLFDGINCPIKINVVNKLNQPIYIDWSKSAVIINGQRLSYWSDVAIINTLTRSAEIKWTEDISTTRGFTSGIIVKNERVSFIPPKSGIVYSPMNLVSNWMELPDASDFKKIDVPTEIGILKGYFYNYERKDSPLEFRSFLTISPNEQFTNPTYFDNVFWVNEVLETQAKPAELLNTFSNNFHTKKLTGFGGFLTGVAGGILILLVIINNL